MISIFLLHGESATRYEGVPRLQPSWNLSKFYFGIDFPDNGSFIAIETPQASGIVSADLDLGPAALQLALFVSRHSRLEFQPAVRKF